MPTSLKNIDKQTVGSRYTLLKALRNDLVDQKVRLSYTEKIDGSGISFGVTHGSVYTKIVRENIASNAGAVYSASDYDAYTNRGYAKIAHAAFEANRENLLTLGTFWCSAEVLYTPIPNSVIYDIPTNTVYIYIIPSNVRLANALKKRLVDVTVSVDITESPDGKTAVMVNKTLDVKFRYLKQTNLTKSQLDTISKMTLSYTHSSALTQKFTEALQEYLFTIVKPSTDAAMPEGYVFTLSVSDRDEKNKHYTPMILFKLVYPTFSSIRKIIWSYRNHINGRVKTLKFPHATPLPIFGSLLCDIAAECGNKNAGTSTRGVVSVFTSASVPHRSSYLREVDRDKINNLISSAVTDIERHYQADLKRDYYAELSEHYVCSDIHINEIRVKNALATYMTLCKIEKLRMKILIASDNLEILNVIREI